MYETGEKLPKKTSNTIKLSYILVEIHLFFDKSVKNTKLWLPKPETMRFLAKLKE